MNFVRTNTPYTQCIFSLCFFFLCTPVTYTFSTDSKTQQKCVNLRSFVQAHKADKNDLLLLLNILYFSYARSAATLTAQDRVAGHLDMVLKTNDCICSTRRNPSIAQPHAISEAAFIASAKYAASTYETYKTAARTYAQCTEYVLKDVRFANQDFSDYIKRERSYIKKTICKKVSVYYEVLKKMIAELSKLATDNATRPTLMQNIAIMLPFFTEKTFTAIDLRYIPLSKKCWQLSLAHNTTYNTIWKLVETERAQFYLELYTVCYDELEKIDASVLEHACLFDSEGFIEKKNRPTLPQPGSLLPLREA
ncbi:MAG: hypothetical protein UU47_C0011G0015 [candidate division TM6 bacterium GW2011_GWE2_41_16]|nr:MAG: hypothetical protein UU47_C0011G0015 [candidate division TM6 bacterium GW2011_GWE2_41_16]